MSTFLPDFAVVSPASLAEALDALAADPKLRPLAGGTDVMVYMEAGTIPPSTFLDLSRVAELRGLAIKGDSLEIGALATYRDLRANGEVVKGWPLLGIAAREVGVLGIQSRGTWAGNIANASPAADGVPALMAYDASIALASVKGERRVALADFYSGYKKMDLRDGELITRIIVPRPPAGRREFYRKVGTRRFQAITKTLLAGWLTTKSGGAIEDLRIVLGSVAPHTLRASRVENALRGKAIDAGTIAAAQGALQEEIAPIDDIRSTREYRRKVTANLLEEFLAG